jgi:hypothetical protein
MTAKNFPPPTGAPVSRVAPGKKPGAQPHAAVQAAAASDPDVTDGRFLVPTSRMLRGSRLVAALACLIAAAVGAWVLTATWTSLDGINRGTQQLLRLQQIKGDVLRADGFATHGLAQGAPASAITEYNDALKESARLTVEASQAQPLDQSDLTSVNAALLNYVLTMERARTTFPQDNTAGLTYVNDAGTVLNSDAVPALDKLIAANESRVDAARAGDRLWAAGLALVPVLLLLGISIWAARRTRRVVNIGLIVALAASIVLWRLVDSNLVTSASVVDDARAGSLQTATEAATAYSSLAEAKSIEGRMLLQPSTVGAAEPTWTAAMTEVKGAVGKLGAQSAKVSGLVTTYSTAHTALSDLLKQNKVTEARASAANTTTGVNPTHKAASDALSQVFSDAKIATASDMSAQQDGLNIAVILAILLGLLGAIASWVGLSQRIREYR